MNIEDMPPDLKKHIESLEGEKELLGNIIDASPLLISVKDEDFKYKKINKAFSDFLKLKEDEVIGLTDFDLFSVATAERQRKKDIEVLFQGNNIECEVKINKVWMDETKKPFKHLEHPNRGLITTWREIGKRKNMEETLRKNTQRLSKIYHSIAVGISILTPDGKYIDSNETWLQMTGYSKRELIKQDMYSLTHDDHVKYSINMNKKLLNGKSESYHIEKIYQRKDGTLFWGDVRVSALHNRQGEVDSLIAVVVDISEKKELESLKEDINRIMQHDLKSPLNAIIGFPGVLKDHKNLTEQQLRILNIIEESGIQMLNMINLSLHMCKMERGEYEYSPQNIDVLKIINKVIEENFAIRNIKKLSINILLNNIQFKPGDSYYMPSDELLFYSMMCNLLKNAVEAAPENSPIGIEISRGSDNYIIRIHNLGAVPEPMRNKFFDKYATYGEKGGSGLGTYSAKLITETMNGNIAMTTSEAEGTSLILSFPNMENSID